MWIHEHVDDEILATGSKKFFMEFFCKGEHRCEATEGKYKVQRRWNKLEDINMLLEIIQWSWGNA